MLTSRWPARGRHPENKNGATGGQAPAGVRQHHENSTVPPPGANIGDELAVFEPVHGSAPKYAGQDKVNPMATILSGALMLRHLGEAEAADRVESGVANVVACGTHVTYDLKPTRDDPTAVGTQAMASAIIEAMG